MGLLIEEINLRNLVDGANMAECYKNNSLFFYNKYQKSDDMVKNINISNIEMGYFYHFVYEDSSNWMKYCPVFVCDFKYIKSTIILLAINLNFIPMEYRVLFFDKFYDKKNVDSNNSIKCSYSSVYDALRSIGYEYSLVEYDVKLLQMIHMIDMKLVPRFLMSGDPINKYDPKKLYSIANTKLPNSEKRDNAIKKATLDDFYSINKEIDESYNILKNHIKRLQTNEKKYGNLY